MEGWKQGAKNSVCYGYDKENILSQTVQMASGSINACGFGSVS